MGNISSVRNLFGRPADAGGMTSGGGGSDARPPQRFRMTGINSGGQHESDEEDTEPLIEKTLRQRLTAGTASCLDFAKKHKILGGVFLCVFLYLLYHFGHPFSRAEESTRSQNLTLSFNIGLGNGSSPLQAIHEHHFQGDYYKGDINALNIAMHGASLMLHHENLERNKTGLQLHGVDRFYQHLDNITPEFENVSISADRKQNVQRGRRESGFGVEEETLADGTTLFTVVIPNFAANGTTADDILTNYGFEVTEDTRPALTFALHQATFFSMEDASSDGEKQVTDALFRERVVQYASAFDIAPNKKVDKHGSHAGTL